MAFNQSLPRVFHQAKWSEPIIFELDQPGERGILVPSAEKEIVAKVGSIEKLLPETLKRKTPIKLPRINQKRVLTHYLRLSQQTLGGDLNIEIGQGTCTVKYNPKINDQLAIDSKMSCLHPLQDVKTTQGILEVMHTMDSYMREISGMDQFTFQVGGGSQACMVMASLVRQFHRSKGEDDRRDEVITTVYSHPSDAAAPALKGYKIIYIMPDENGYPDYESFKAAVGPRTAAFFVANPEDTGIFNNRILEFTKLVHDAGGLNCYDQANGNGLLGVTRAKEAGFDMCFFNLHKTFGTPHGCGGPGAAALGVTKDLVDFLPKPIVDFDGKDYFLNFSGGDPIEKIMQYQGIPQNILRAYCWIRSLGGEGLYEVAKVAALNNNYLIHKLLKHKGISIAHPEAGQRVEQARYSLEKMTLETGITSSDIARRVMDFGMHIWSSHHPYYVPEPLTLEPTETPSRADLDEYILTLHHIFDEAYESPEVIQNAPHQSTIHKVIESSLDDPSEWLTTWRVYKKLHEK